MSDLYSQYHSYVKKICETKDISSFKRNPSYTYVLEHVTAAQGAQYLKLIKETTSIPLDSIIEFCKINDTFGNPNKHIYDGFDCSPTSLRYVYHAHIILTYMASLGKTSHSIVEVGGGYGGMCLAIHYFSAHYGITIDSYSITDLTSIIELQKLYLANFPSIIKNLDFYDASTYGQTIDKHDLFLISNYCFSEIHSEHRQKYKEILFPKVSHGFLAWNFIPVYDFGFPLRVENEVPNTGGALNKYVYF